MKKIIVFSILAISAMGIFMGCNNGIDVITGEKNAPIQNTSTHNENSNNQYINGTNGPQ